MSALTDPTTFLGEDGLRQATEYVPGAARNDGMPSQRVAYAEAVRAIQAPSPTAPKDSQWEEEGPLEGAPNRDPDQIPIAPVVVFPKPIFSASRSELLQQWEGTVVEVDSGWMKVTLDSLTEHESTEEQATKLNWMKFRMQIGLWLRWAPYSTGALAIALNPMGKRR